MAESDLKPDRPAGNTNFVGALREALILAQADADADPLSSRRDALQRQVDIAAEPVMRLCFDGIRKYCASLVRESPSLKQHADGDDIAQDVWTAAVRYLKTDSGARIRDDVHFYRFLRMAAKRRFLDIRGTPTASFEEAPSILNRAARESSVAFFATLSTDRAMEMIELLFTDEEAFRAACRRPVRRRPMHYRGLVLFHLGQFLESEGVVRDATGRGSPDPLLLSRMRRFADTLGIDATTWHAVEIAVTRCAAAGGAQLELDELLEGEVNRLCGSSLKLGNNMSVLRTEMNGFVSG